ncbi:uncharacterized protein LOC123554635 [Mercenaria mercenaria]|uniref:uncharacterized protein LOC123554635 n=1 Tax=Mercenaria mercenaria TaxID=6596 RepID=UPI00234F5101|nr:uncharacterized protein LOC123554635 [Mercenaria mercenaria]
MDFSVKKLTLLILVVATCIELALLLSMVIYWRLSREELPEDKKQQQQLCYRSDRFPTHSDHISICPRGLEMNMKNDTKTCCGNSDLILDNLVTKALSEKYNSDVNPELPSLDLELDQCNVTRIKPPMVKLIGLAGDINPVKQSNSSKIFWNSNIQTYATSGLTYKSDEGTICVGKAGYYFIHSQLKVKVISTNDTDDDVRDIFTHNVRLIKKDTSSIILEDRKSQCEMASKESEITSAVGGVFWLEQKDRLYVATSHPKRIVQRDNCIVFSMHSL